MKKHQTLGTRLGLVVAFLACCLLQLPLQAQDGQSGGEMPNRAASHPEGRHAPPTTGRLVGDHWTPYEPPSPESFPEGATIHLIVTGDTLWDLSASYLEDPFLWPQIWDVNQYISDSHWIYPGDPVLIPGKPTVISTGGATTEAMLPHGQLDLAATVPAASGPGALAAAHAPAASSSAMLPKMPMLSPVGGEVDVNCANYIVSDFQAPGLEISHREDGSRTILGTGDIVFLNRGMGDSLTPGDEFTVIQNEGLIFHPILDEAVGHSVRMLARVRVIALQENSATAEIVQACDAVRIGMHLVPYKELPIPLATPVGFRRFGVQLDVENAGYIVDVTPDKNIIGEGDIVNVDLGSENGLRPGDVLTVFREWVGEIEYASPDTYLDGVQARAELDRLEGLNPEGFAQSILGQMVVLMTEGNTATGKIVHSSREIELGDRVALN